MSVVKGFFDGLRPTIPMPVSDWADENRHLSAEASSEPGKWRTSRTPYLREIMDKLSANDITQEVVVRKGAQLGFTEGGNNWLGYIIDVAPGPTLMVMPTTDTVKRNSKIRIDPMISESPVLRKKVKPARSRDSDNTIFSKAFPGGVLVMTGANSAVGLRSMPVKNLFLDEVDGYPVDLDGEGSPLDLARARTRTFARKKVFIISTPTIDGASVIDAEYYTTDQRKYFVPCPHCGEMQPLEWEGLVWTKGAPETVRYKCQGCGELIQERHKTSMLAGGKWIPTAPENLTTKKVGYHINSLYSPWGWYSWADAVSDFEKAENDANKIKTFTNTVLGLTYAEKGDAPAWESLYNRREPYEINKPVKDVCFLTAGVDVQADRLEVEIVGWGKGKISWSIDYRVLLGDTAARPVWDKLGAMLSEQWERSDGSLMPLRMMAIDTGYNTTMVYEFCRRHDSTRVIPIKGQDSQAVIITAPRSVDKKSNGKKIGRLHLWNVGVSLIKSELYGWLRLNINEDNTFPVGFCHFPEYDNTFFRGITAESLEFKIIRGYRRYQWVKKYQRNEPLDCRVYARAAAAVVGIDRFGDAHFDAIATGYQLKQVNPGKKKPPRRSSYWED